MPGFIANQLAPLGTEFDDYKAAFRRLSQNAQMFRGHDTIQRPTVKGAWPPPRLCPANEREPLFSTATPLQVAGLDARHPADEGHSLPLAGAAGPPVELGGGVRMDDMVRRVLGVKCPDSAYCTPVQ